MRAAPAIGSLVTSIVVAHRPPMKRTGAALFGSVTLFGLAIIGFALSRNFVLSFLLLTLSGMADNVSVIIRSTLLQTLTPAHLLGRVSSVIFGGCMTLLVVAITMWRATELRRMGPIQMERS